MATHRAAGREPDTANPTLAHLSTLAGLIGIAGSWLPWNTGTAYIAAAGLLAGLVGIWVSRQILSGVGTVLCATGLMLTVAFGVALDARAEPVAPEPAVWSLDGGC